MAAEFAIAFRSGILRKNCWAGTHSVPPPRPSSPAIKPIATPIPIVLADERSFGFEDSGRPRLCRKNSTILYTAMYPKNPANNIARYRPLARAKYEQLLTATPIAIPTTAAGISRIMTGFTMALALR